MEQDGKVVFLHKVMSGAADKSYGIYVADLAGLLTPLLDRAKELLERFESADKAAVQSAEPEQLALFDLQGEGSNVLFDEESEVLEKLDMTDVLNMTPLNACNSSLN